MHRSGDPNYSVPPMNISFLDLLIIIHAVTKELTTDLYQKAKLFPFKAVGIDILLSNTLTSTLASVFLNSACIPWVGML